MEHDNAPFIHRASFSGWRRTSVELQKQNKKWEVRGRGSDRNGKVCDHACSHSWRHCTPSSIRGACRTTPRIQYISASGRHCADKLWCGIHDFDIGWARHKRVYLSTLSENASHQPIWVAWHRRTSWAIRLRGNFPTAAFS